VALKSELMASGMSAGLAKRIGFDPPTNFVPATGGQTGGATLLSANHAIVAPSAGSQGVLLADAEQIYFIYNSASTSAQTISVYPPVGAFFTGKTVNSPVSLPTAQTLWIEPGGTGGITWAVGATG
jgi:hypothetical protein